MTDLNIFTIDDWQGVYIDGKLINQTHRVSVSTIIQGLIDAGVDIRFTSEWVDDKINENFIEFPQTLEEWNKYAV